MIVHKSCIPGVPVLNLPAAKYISFSSTKKLLLLEGCPCEYYKFQELSKACGVFSFEPGKFCLLA